MAFPQDQINNKIAFDSVIRDGLNFVKDNVLLVKERTWFLKFLIEKLNVRIGSNPGTNTRLEGYTTMYNVIQEHAKSTFREIMANDETNLLTDDPSKYYNLRVPINAGITTGKKTTLSEFLMDEQTGIQLDTSPDVFYSRISGYYNSLTEVIAKWLDMKLIDLIFNKEYEIELPDNSNTLDTTQKLKLNYPELANMNLTITNYKDLYTIQEQLIFTETISRDTEEMLGIAMMPPQVLAKFKQQFKDDAGFNAMTADERKGYVEMNKTDYAFVFPGSRILCLAGGYHLTNKLLNEDGDGYEIKFVSKEAIEQINFLPNVFDDLARYTSTASSLFGNTAGREKVTSSWNSPDFPMTLLATYDANVSKISSYFSWFAGIRFTMKPFNPKRAVASFKIDNSLIGNDVAGFITSQQVYFDAVMARITNS